MFELDVLLYFGLNTDYIIINIIYSIIGMANVTVFTTYYIVSKLMFTLKY